jgi:hypothetical protein
MTLCCIKYQKVLYTWRLVIRRRILVIRQLDVHEGLSAAEQRLLKVIVNQSCGSGFIESGTGSSISSVSGSGYRPGVLMSNQN